MFYGNCYGLKTDISIGGALTLSFWKGIENIPGRSYPASLGLSLGLSSGGVDAGVSIGAVIAKKDNFIMT